MIGNYNDKPRNSYDRVLGKVTLVRSGSQDFASDSKEAIIFMAPDDQTKAPPKRRGGPKDPIVKPTSKSGGK